MTFWDGLRKAFTKNDNFRLLVKFSIKEPFLLPEKKSHTANLVVSIDMMSIFCTLLIFEDKSIEDTQRNLNLVMFLSILG